MDDAMPTLSPEKPVASPNPVHADDDFDMAFHEPPSSPFIEHIDFHDQENIAPGAAPTPSKPLADFDDEPQSAFKVSPEKRPGLKEHASPTKGMPVKNLMDDFEEAARNDSAGSRTSPRKQSPVKRMSEERSGSALSNGSLKSQSPSKSSRAPSIEATHYEPVLDAQSSTIPSTPSHGRSTSRPEPTLRENEGLTVAMKFMNEMRTERQENLTRQRSYDDKYDLDLDIDNTEFNPDGPEGTSADIDDTGFSMFSEMPGMDMTKFASLQKSPIKDGLLDVSASNPHSLLALLTMTIDAACTHTNDSLDCSPLRSHTITNAPPFLQRKRHHKPPSRLHRADPVVLAIPKRFARSWTYFTKQIKHTTRSPLILPEPTIAC
jgi:hypothetical protein